MPSPRSAQALVPGSAHHPGAGSMTLAPGRPKGGLGVGLRSCPASWTITPAGARAVVDDPGQPPTATDPRGGSGSASSGSTWWGGRTSIVSTAPHEALRGWRTRVGVAVRVDARRGSVMDQNVDRSPRPVRSSTRRCSPAESVETDAFPDGSARRGDGPATASRSAFPDGTPADAGGRPEADHPSATGRGIAAATVCRWGYVPTLPLGERVGRDRRTHHLAGPGPGDAEHAALRAWVLPTGSAPPVADDLAASMLKSRRGSPALGPRTRRRRGPGPVSTPGTRACIDDLTTSWTCYG
jgi:hypothetical protein